MKRIRVALATLAFVGAAVVMVAAAMEPEIVRAMFLSWFVAAPLVIAGAALVTA